MDTTVIAWGHNPGQRFVKDTLTVGDRRKDLKPYPAVIAPWQSSDSTGLDRQSRDLVATVNGSHYIGGDSAERLPLQNRQMSHGRLDEDSPIYQALAQMSAQHTGLVGKNASVLIATAMPSAWRSEESEAQLKAHIRTGLRDIVTIKNIIVQSEPNAIIFHEVLDDNGQSRNEDSRLMTDLVCVGDIGGSTLNRTVVDGLRSLPGQADSPFLGSRQVVESLMKVTGQQYIDAERRIIAAVRNPGKDQVADSLLRQYREAVVAEFQRAWANYKPVLHIFAGGTVHWLAGDLMRAFDRVRIVDNPQQAIAVGLWRYARRKLLRG